MIGGELNAKHSLWGCISDNSRGKILQKIINNNNYTHISPNGPSYWPQHLNRHPDILDFFISTLPSYINFSVTNLNDLSSDHIPVLLQLNVAPDLNPMHPSLSQGPIKWNEFAEIMQNTTNLKISLKSKTDIENAAQVLTTSIQSAIYKSSHPYTPRSMNQTNNQTLPIHIRTLISDKRRVRSRWQKYRYPSDKQIFNHLTNTIKKLISKHKSEFFEKKISIPKHK